MNERIQMRSISNAEKNTDGIFEDRSIRARRRRDVFSRIDQSERVVAVTPEFFQKFSNFPNLRLSMKRDAKFILFSYREIISQRSGKKIPKR